MKRIFILFLSATLSLTQVGKSKAEEHSISRLDTTRLAIVLGGAVSLGAFEAGVITELVRQLEIHNRSQAKTKFVVDILAGASAGSLTIGLLARELFFFPDSVDFKQSQSYSKRNAFYQAWVKAVDITKLLLANRDLTKDPYIFARDSIEAIANRFIHDGTSGQKLQIAPEKLHVAFTLSSMNGIKHTIEFEDHEETEFYLYDDVRFFEIENDGRKVIVTDANGIPADTLDWQSIAETTLASAAYPFAFRPKQLERHPKENNMPLGERPYYVDGGFFNNHPLHVAKQIAARIDRRPIGIYKRSENKRPRRKFIFITPTDFEEEVSGEDSVNFDEEKITKLTKYLSHLFKMGLTTARTLDYRLYLRDEKEDKSRFLALVDSVHSLKDEPDLVEDLLRTIQIFSKFGTQSANIHLMRQFTRNYKNLLSQEEIKISRTIESQLLNLVPSTYPKTYKEVRWLITADSSFKQLFVDLFHIKGLESPSRSILISNDAAIKLGGSNYAAFAGFLNEDIRRDDYEFGLRLGRIEIGRHLRVSAPTTLSALNPDVAPGGQVALPKLRMRRTLKDHIPNEKRALLRKRIDERLIGYTKHLDKRYSLLPVLELADTQLDKDLYRTPKSGYVTWHINSDRPRSFNLGLEVNPWNLILNEYYQPSGLGWLLWFPLHESHFVLDVGWTDFVTKDKPLGRWYHTNLGWRVSFYFPNLNYVKLQPEIGTSRRSALLQDDIGQTGKWGGYFGLTLRVLIFDLKVIQFYPSGLFENGSNRRINFGISVGIFDQLLRGRL